MAEERPVFCREISNATCDSCDLREVREDFWRRYASRNGPEYLSEQIAYELRRAGGVTIFGKLTQGVVRALNNVDRNIVPLVAPLDTITIVNDELMISRHPDYADGPAIYAPTHEAQLFFSCFARNQRDRCLP